MSQMIERVAKAMAELDLGHGIWPRLPEAERNVWVFRAWAGIAAMREPTAEMRLADAVKEWPDDAAVCWRAMIDAALASKEGTNGPA